MNIITWVFAICSMALVAVGIMEYKNIAVTSLETYKLRTSLSYVATKVRQGDGEGAVELRNINGTDMLLLCENVNGTSYETAIYWYDGVLREHYHEKGAEFSPKSGFEVVAVTSFVFEKSEEGLFKITASDVDGCVESMYLCVNSYRR